MTKIIASSNSISQTSWKRLWNRLCTWYPRFYEVVHTWNHSNSGVAVVVKYYYMLGNILGFIKNRYYSHFLLTFPIQKCNICYSKLTKILIFASFCFSTLQLFWRKTMSKMTSFAVTKACQGCSSCSAAAVNPLV